MGPNNKSGAGYYRESVSRHPEILSASAASIISFLWFLPRLSEGIAFGPWQGPLLADFPVHSLPVLSRWLVAAASYVGIGSGPRLLNLVSASFGAISCGLVAAVGTMVSKKAFPSFEAGLAGLLTALVFAATPTITYASTGPAPTTLSMSLALLSIVVLLAALEQRSPTVFLAASGLAAGLAAANHPSFGLLFLFIVLTLIVLHFEVGQVLTAFTCACLAFAGGAILPLVSALTSGESIPEFFSHALRTPYPALGDGWPEAGFARRLSTELPGPLLLAAMPSIVLFFRRGTRPYAFLCVGVFACMGPLLPALTNQYGHDAGLTDPDAPLAIALAMFCLYVGWGVAVAVAYLIRPPKIRWLRVAALILAAVGAVAFQSRQAPSRRHDFAQKTAQALIASCPENAALISGDRGLTSLVLAAQETGGIRPDLTVISTESLTDPLLRKKLAARVEGGLALEEKLAGLDVLGEGQSKPPYLLRRLVRNRQGGARNSEILLNLALWEFVEDNFSSRPVCFVGITLPWLTARAQASGCVIIYPHQQATSAPAPETLAAQLYERPEYRTDPAIRRTLSQILLPLSESARNQKNVREAARLAQHAALLSPEPPGARLALARAAARDGKKWSAIEYASACFPLMATREKMDESIKLIEADVHRARLEQRFQKFLIQGPEHFADPAEERRRLTDELWEVDELAVLAEGYEYIVEDSPEDHEALFEYAAALAQFGDLGHARSALERWSRLAQLSGSEVARILEEDGRFALLK